MPEQQTTDNRKACQSLMAELVKAAEKALKAVPDGIDDAVCGCRSAVENILGHARAEAEHLDWHAKHEAQP